MPESPTFAVILGVLLLVVVAAQDLLVFIFIVFILSVRLWRVGGAVVVVFVWRAIVTTAAPEHKQQNNIKRYYVWLDLPTDGSVYGTLPIIHVRDKPHLQCYNNQDICTLTPVQKFSWQSLEHDVENHPYLSTAFKISDASETFPLPVYPTTINKTPALGIRTV